MRIQYALLLPLAIACASSPREADSRSLAAFGIADQGTFVVTLGRDTIAAERFRFGRARLEGEVVTRRPETVRRPYAMTFDSMGNPVRLEFSTRRPTDTPASPPIQSIVITLPGDTIVMATKRNDTTVTRRIPAPRGAVPLLGQSYASYEILTRRAVRAGADSVQIPTWTVGAQRTDEFSIVRVNADTMRIIGPAGAIYARVDAEGRIQGVNALGTTVKVLVTRGPMTDLTSIAMMAPIPQLSPRDTIRTSIAGANFIVSYSRPTKRGRVIFGSEIVPWGEVWRTGANEATHFHTDKDVVIGGTPVPAGTYTLWTIPRPEGWTLIINKQTGQWGTIYDPAQDLARIEMQDEAPATLEEQFTISLEPKEPGAVLRLRWDDREAWVPIEIK